MSQQIDATFIGGVFRPDRPVDIADGAQVSLTIVAKPTEVDDLADVADLLDVEFVSSCRQHAGNASSLEEVRTILGAYGRPLSELIIEEREER
jgi:predicted DNA-binding antitoxin AbrB/MazE fold protein